MTKIAILTKEQHREVYGLEYTKGMRFNPVLDKDGNIIISEQEVNQLTNTSLAWVKDLTLIEETEVLKPENWTKDQWIAYEIAEAEKRKLELEKLKTTEIKK